MDTRAPPPLRTLRVMLQRYNTTKLCDPGGGWNNRSRARRVLGRTYKEMTIAIEIRWKSRIDGRINRVHAVNREHTPFSPFFFRRLRQRFPFKKAFKKHYCLFIFNLREYKPFFLQFRSSSTQCNQPQASTSHHQWFRRGPGAVFFLKVWDTSLKKNSKPEKPCENTRISQKSSKIGDFATEFP